MEYKYKRKHNYKMLSIFCFICLVCYWIDAFHRDLFFNELLKEGLPLEEIRGSTRYSGATDPFTVVTIYAGLAINILIAYLEPKYPTLKSAFTKLKNDHVRIEREKQR